MTSASAARASGPESFDEAQAVVALNDGLLREKGVILLPESQILDFGCGSGGHVYEYLDQGFAHTVGYDIANYASLRAPEDARHFRFETTGRLTAIPFADGHFDFVYSYSVFEHVQEPERALEEIYRVLKPGGVSLHVFPAKWRPAEPHMKVPLGGAFQSYSYLRLWAALGVRNEFQKTLGARETAERNHRYTETGIRYLEGREIDALLRAIFDEVSYEEALFLKHSQGRAHRLHRPVTAFPLLARLFRALHTRVVFLRKRGA